MVGLDALAVVGAGEDERDPGDAGRGQMLAGDAHPDQHRPHRFGAQQQARAIVAAAGGLALLPGYTSRPDPGVVLRPLADLPAGRHIDVLARPESLQRAGVRTVLGALREIAGRHVSKCRNAS
jgi:DNA-binding transcriptional LysR family regulator